MNANAWSAVNLGLKLGLFVLLSACGGDADDVDDAVTKLLENCVKVVAHG